MSKSKRYGMQEEEYQYGQQALSKMGFKPIQLDKEMERNISIAHKDATQKALEKAAETKFQAAEEEAYRAGKSKSGFLGLFGSYSGKSKEDFMDKGDAASTMDKAGAVASLTEMATGKSMGSLTGTGSMGDGAIKGATMGAKFGVPGAAVGAVAGAMMGAAASREARKAKEREIEAQKLAALGKIEQEKGQQLSKDLDQMGRRMSISSTGFSRKSYD